MRVIYMGTPNFAVAPLEAIAEAGHELVAVLTQPDKPNSRRGKDIIFSPVKQAALKRSLPVYQPVNISDDMIVATLRALCADIIIVCAYGQLLKSNVLNLTKYGCINIHASLLPKYRGAAPVHRAIMDGQSETGVTLMYMNEGLDTGDIMISEQTSIVTDDTVGTLFDRLSDLGAELIVKGMKLLSLGTAPRTPQNDAQSSYANKISKTECSIDFSLDAAVVYNKIRGLNPFPGAYAIFNRKIIKLYDTKLLSECYNMQAGTLVGTQGDGIVVVCKNGSILIETLKPEGKRLMKAAEFWAGLQDKENAKFDI